MYKTILFDLDGSLLPLDESGFIKLYFGGVYKRFANFYKPEEFMQAFLEGTYAMMKNDGKQTNEEAFWKKFKELIKGDYDFIEKEFLDYYENEFKEVKKVCRVDPYSRKIIDILKSKGYQLVLATNPLFPKVATKERIKWAGLEDSAFDLITTYEDNYYCKPKLEYYQSILKRIGRRADECLMVGNDVREDMVVEELGMKTYLLTECLNNPDNKDISKYQQGRLEDLYRFIVNF
ncbi:MAG: HAD family hydrolase [Bacilli bacterium]|nr:HAD family hydrolase [Bacilli bacterium]